MTQEGNRRIRNCDLEMPWTQKVEYINRLMVSMKWGGYSQGFREIVARRVLAKYSNDVYNLQQTGKPLYRSKEQRSQVMKPDKASWFRTNWATATFTVPNTKHSVLAKRLRQVLEGTGPRGTSVLVLERPGVPIMTGISKNNPFPRDKCTRTDCLYLEDNCKEQCYREGIIYEATCMRCKELD